MENVNKLTAKDGFYAGVKAALGTIPVLGSAATELFGLIITPPIDQRRNEWMNQVADKLKELEQKSKIDFNALKHNQQFIDVILHASSLAIKTSEQEKILALKNAVINTALDEQPNSTKIQVFLNLIDNFTIWHIKILHFFDDPKEWFAKAQQTPPNLMIGSMHRVLIEAYPELKKESELLNLIWRDLHNAGLHNSSELKATMSGDSVLSRRTSKLGKEFLDFIRE